MSYIKSIQTLLLEQYCEMEHYNKVSNLAGVLRHYHNLEDAERMVKHSKMDTEHITQAKNQVIDIAAHHHGELMSYQNSHGNHPGYCGHILHEPFLDMLKHSKAAHDVAGDSYFDKYNEEIGV